jgi:hypothetical protein
MSELNNQLRQKCIEAGNTAYWKAHMAGREQRMGAAFDAMLDVLADGPGPDLWRILNAVAAFGHPGGSVALWDEILAVLRNGRTDDA